MALRAQMLEHIMSNIGVMDQKLFNKAAKSIRSAGQENMIHSARANVNAANGVIARTVKGKGFYGGGKDALTNLHAHSQAGKEQINAMKDAAKNFQEELDFHRANGNEQGARAVEDKIFALNKMKISQSADMMGGMAKRAGGVVWSGSIGQKAAKVGTLGAAYVAANGLLRAPFGGGPFHNSDGERDIAGIPFI